MKQVTTLSLPGDDARSPLAAAARGPRLHAALMDLLALVGGTVLAVLAGFAYLLLRTGWGATDVGDSDSALAMALLLAVPPTWAAWLLLSVAEHRATPGQRRAGLLVAQYETGWRAARLLRIAVHPLSLPFWLWAIVMLQPLLAVPLLPWLVLLWSALVVIGGLSSMVLFVVRPGTPAVHDWVTRTRVVVTE